MAHETYLTTHDKIETAVQVSHRGLFMSWGAATLGFAAASFLTGGLATFAGVALAAGAAISGLKVTESFFNDRKSIKHKVASHGSSSQKELPPHLANNLEPIPELADDVSTSKWRTQLAEEARNAVQRNAGRGF